jgi:S-adenosylmethionine:tRNA ribosyltransferase-isomerase
MILNNHQKLVCKTQILIAPPYQLKIAKGIITNFHQPKSTLLLLISAIVGDKWKEIYQYALKNNFRFLSYGDSSLLLP